MGTKMIRGSSLKSLNSLTHSDGMPEADPCTFGGWSKALLALFACHPKFLASAKLFVVPKVPNFKKSPSILCTIDSLANLTNI